jgi:hypothetical protein
MTEVEFSRLLSELSSTSKKLNSESDSINEVLSRVEKQIAETNVGLEVQVYLEGEGGKYLQWRKVGKAGDAGAYKEDWGLAIDGHHVLERSRDARIAALDTLPALIRELTSAADTRIKSIERAKNLVKK